MITALYISPALKTCTVVSGTGSGPLNPPPNTKNLLPTDTMLWQVLGDGGLPQVSTVSHLPFSTSCSNKKGNTTHWKNSATFIDNPTLLIHQGVYLICNLQQNPDLFFCYSIV